MMKKLPMNVPFEEGPLPQLIQKLDAFCSSLNEQQKKDFEELMELLAVTDIDEEEELNVVLGDFLVKKGDKIKYEYDFGDRWVHEIELIADPVKDGAQTVKLLTGKNACPPEDFGGPWRYNAFLQALRDGDTDRLDDEFEGIMNWLPDDFEPEYFDVDEFRDAIDAFVFSGYRADLPF